LTRYRVSYKNWLVPPKNSPAVRAAAEEFSRVLAAALRTLIRSMRAALLSDLVAARRGGASAKSSPAQAARLRARILDVLGRASGPMPAQGIFAALHLRETDRARLSYALDRLKESGAISQVGARRTARYALPATAADSPAS
jgi:hypothetical protein